MGNFPAWGSFLHGEFSCMRNFPAWEISHRSILLTCQKYVQTSTPDSCLDVQTTKGACRRGQHDFSQLC